MMAMLGHSMNEPTLSTEQLEVIKVLWSKDPEFREIVETRVREYASRAQKEAQELLNIANRTQGLFDSKQPQRPPLMAIMPRPQPRTRGSTNHRQAITTALRIKPGMNVGELYSYLMDKEHQITRRVLNSLLNQYKEEYRISGGKRGLRADGDKPFTKFYAP